MLAPRKGQTVLFYFRRQDAFKEQSFLRGETLSAPHREICNSNAHRGAAVNAQMITGRQEYAFSMVLAIECQGRVLTHTSVYNWRKRTKTHLFFAKQLYIFAV